MNNTTRNTMEQLPQAILEEAATWQARLRDAGTDTAEGSELLRAFNAWHAADARHRQAYEEMEALWSALETPVAQVMAEQPTSKTTTESSIPRTSRRTRQRPFGHAIQRMALAACLLLAIGAGIGWQQDWVTQWQSDHMTAVGEEAPVLMDDGSRITLNTDSALAVNFNSKQRRVRLLKGEAWFEVSPADNRPFILETGAGAVRVTGTRFNVRLHEHKAIVSLDEGRVELRSPNTSDESPVVLSPGQQSTLSAQGVSSPTTFDHTAVTAWLRGQFVFYDTPLAEVVDTLNRHRRGRIIITNDELNTLRVSGIFSTDEPDDALQVITDTLPIRLTRLTDYLVFIR